MGDPIDPVARMVLEQIESRGIRDERVLAAMRSVSRARFVDPSLLASAYDDGPLPIERGQTISQPYVVALMTEALEIEPEHRVLEIGTGSGYQAAVLSKLAKEVCTVERHEDLCVAAAKRLARLGYSNVHVSCADGSLGWEERAPFDRIVVTAGAPSMPRRLVEQLAPGGRIVIPVGGSPEEQDLVRAERDGSGTLRCEHLCSVRFVPLVGAGGWFERR